MTAMRLKRYPSPSGGFALGKMGVGATLMSAAKTARDYVQDGLVAMWDGIENAGWDVHDASATTWKDLIGGIEAACNTSPVWNDNSFDCGTGTRRFEFQITTDLYDAIIGNSITAECCVGTINTGKNDNGMFGIGTARYTNNGFTLKVNSATNTACDFIARGGSAPSGSFLFLNSTYFGIVNGSSVSLGNNGATATTRTLTGATSISSTGTFMLGNMGIASNLGGFSGLIHACRFYSRPLSEAELAHNYAIDKERFKLP